jgi:hypothetical protein
MTKDATFPRLVDENSFEAFVDDHEELGAKNDDLEELPMENEE